jgi:hypothetical protein
MINIARNPMTIIKEQLLGQFKKNKKNGKGTLYFDNGNKYIGDWIDDQKAGNGIFLWSNDNRYERRSSEIVYHHL